MKRIVLILVMLISLALTASCTTQAEELYETAKLEEIQQNPEHARRLYEEILQKYPDSEFAVFARDRLAELDIQTQKP
ncbi:MAG: tetratricopeptide repeat protein [Desulfobacterales bacterium]|nr:tetratricopeptide repeat protein [Desulfobacterales bacterium]MDD4071583.1 tetratricopeptide repeat protein [Desulfobacterales bacterium]MDD4391573.1 tetratricopeptide repeat protein [Desulfobacterales bacterium]